MGARVSFFMILGSFVDNCGTPILMFGRGFGGYCFVMFFFIVGKSFYTPALMTMLCLRDLSHIESISIKLHIDVLRTEE